MPRLTGILLESQLIGPLRQAADLAGVELDLFLLHELNEQALRQSVECADAVFGGVLNLDEPVARVAAVLKEVRPRPAVFFHSQVEALACTRIGDFDASTPQWREAVKALKEAGIPLPGLLNVLLAAIPKLERALPPGRFEGLRRYAQAGRLWSDGTVESLAALMRLLCGEEVAAPEPVPQVALWHPRGGFFADLAAYRAWYGERCKAPGVGVILHRRWVAAGNADHFAAVIERLEDEGLAVYAGFSDLDATPLVERFFAPAGVECLLNLISFNLMGGHGQPSPERAAALLARFDRPYLCAVPLVMQTLQEWQESRMGLAPHQAVMQVVMPELEGGAEPWVYAGKGDGDTVVVDPELAARIARRVRKWVALRRTPRSERRIAVTLFSMPPDKGSVGTAAYLDVFQSLWALMRRLKEEGYSVELPASVEELRRAVLGADTALPGAESIAVAGRLFTAEYKRMVPCWPRIARCWGPPPGLVDSDGESIAIRGRAFGNLFVGVQPPFGYEGDPMRLLFHPSASPSHAFAAYYAWVEQVWGAQAVLHFGTHGALEFMPGRQVGLGADDFPAALLGEMPHFYYYSVNNPSEGSIAKRRGGAVIVSHLTPPVAQAGLYRTLRELRDAVRAFQEAPSAPVLEAVRELAQAAHLDDEVPPPDELREAPESAMAGRAGAAAPGQAVTGEAASGEAAPPLQDAALALSEEASRYVNQLADYLTELETRLIPVGLHVAGEATGLEEMARAAASLRGVPEDDPAVQDLVVRAQASDELGALVRALDGRYVPPAPGGDPVRNPEVLPAGRNIHALSPWAVPSRVAMRTGRAMAERLLERLGRIPESVAMVLWGSDNIKTQGEAVAQALWLMGAEPVPDSLGRMSRVRLVPLEELGRPRIDVVITCSGIFRDLFPSVMRLLDAAARAAALADEPVEQNFVRKRALALAEELGVPPEEATRRVFAAQPGQYGTGVNHVVHESAWEQASDIAEVYLKRMAWSYGPEGDAIRSDAVLRAALAGVETAVQHLDSTELGLADIDHYFEHLGGVVAAVQRLRGDRPEAYVMDTGTGGQAVPRRLQEALRIESRTRLLNPKWYGGMLQHGYQGVHEIAQRLDHTFGWQATAGAVDDWVFSGAAEVLREQGERMRALNPQAVHRMASRLLEGHHRGLWRASEQEIEQLQAMRDGLEELMEGIA